ATGCFHPMNKRFDLQFFRADAVYRRNNSAKYMIYACILCGVLDGHHVFAFFNNADNRSVAPVTLADRALVSVADVKACLTKADIGAQVLQRGGECCSSRFVLFNQVKDE